MPGWHAYAPKLDRAWPWSNGSAVRMRAIGVMMVNQRRSRVNAISEESDCGRYELPIVAVVVDGLDDEDDAFAAALGS